MLKLCYFIRYYIQLKERLVECLIFRIHVNDFTAMTYFTIRFGFTSLHFDSIQFDIDYFGYISGIVPAKFSQGKKKSFK